MKGMLKMTMCLLLNAARTMLIIAFSPERIRKKKTNY